MKLDRIARCWMNSKGCKNQGFYQGLSKEPFQRALLTQIYSEAVIAIIALQLKQGKQVERRHWYFKPSNKD